MVDALQEHKLDNDPTGVKNFHIDMNLPLRTLQNDTGDLAENQTLKP